MRRPYRRGLKAMDKPTTTSSKYRTQFWYITVAAILLWIFLLYIFNSSAVTFHNHERLFREEETNFTVSEKRSDSVYTVSNENQGKADDISLPNSSNARRYHDTSLSVSGDGRQDEALDDAKAVNDIVKELEKEKDETEKRETDAEGGMRAEKGNRDLIVRRKRESRKVRSWDRFDSKWKRSSDERATDREEKMKRADDSIDHEDDGNGNDNDNVVDGKQTRTDSGNRFSDTDIDNEQNFFEANNDVGQRKNQSKDDFEAKNRVELQRNQSFEAKHHVELQKDQSKDDFEPKSRIELQKDQFFEGKNGVELQKERFFEAKNGFELKKDRSKDDFQAKDVEELQKDRFKGGFEAKNSVKQQKDQSNKGFKATKNAESQRLGRSENKARAISGKKPGEQVMRRAQNVMIRPRTTYRNDPCAGKYIYMHEIPSLFNEDLLKHCWTLSPWTDMCELTSNLGLGPRLPDMERLSGWYATDQFTLEVIFHNRMKQYKCLTKDSSLASAVFVPYYAGLDVMRFLFGPFPYMRDATALDLMKWLRETREWKRMNGRDHFLVAGRTTWDFMRTPENESDWGNRLMLLPESRNMTMLLIESSPWNYHGLAIPYPTYFHPSTEAEILQWQNRMRKIKRRYLFSFVGAPRPNLGDNIRGEIMDQCRASRRKCKLLECVSGSQKCYKPDQIMKFFLSSTFCLQPPGDSFTRRSTFDSILAGCIPVFFHPGSAYAQYIWHFPRDFARYSVFIPIREVKEGRVSIERVLNKIPRAKVVAMREEVIKLITRVTYFDPRKRIEGFEDAFDVTVKGVLERVEEMRRRMEEGKEEMFEFSEDLSWKYNMFGSVLGRHEWDSYFDRP